MLCQYSPELEEMFPRGGSWDLINYKCTEQMFFSFSAYTCPLKLNMQDPEIVLHSGSVCTFVKWGLNAIILVTISQTHNKFQKMSALITSIIPSCLFVHSLSTNIGPWLTEGIPAFGAGWFLVVWNCPVCCSWFNILVCPLNASSGNQGLWQPKKCPYTFPDALQGSCTN